MLVFHETSALVSLGVIVTPETPRMVDEEGVLVLPVELEVELEVDVLVDELEELVLEAAPDVPVVVNV